MQVTKHALVDVKSDNNNQIRIHTVGEPTLGNAFARYHCSIGSDAANSQLIQFQDGTVDPVSGPNGLTIEALLAICGHRLDAFQSGAYPSEYNAVSLFHINEALKSLQQRTIDRVQREVKSQYVA